LLTDLRGAYLKIKSDLPDLVPTQANFYLTMTSYFSIQIIRRQRL